MKAQELIGKNAIRTKHIIMAGGNVSRSFLDEPIRILKATDEHIVYQYPIENSMYKILSDGNKTHILSYEYCDDKWIDYDELINLDNRNENSLKNAFTNYDPIGNRKEEIDID